MKSWLTPAELAELALPGLPTHRRNIEKLAAREGWDRFGRLSRPRQGRGGGSEYHLQLLPVEARAAYLARFGEGADDAASRAILAAPDPRPGLPSPAQLQRDARLAILGAFQTFRRSTELKTTTAIAYFVDLYCLGRIDAPAWVRDVVPRLSARTLTAWLAKAKTGDVDALAVDRGAARRGQGILDTAHDGQIRLTALALTAHNPHLSADHIRETLIDRFGDAILHRGRSVPFPCVRAIQGALKRWRAEHSQELLALTNPDAFKSRNRVTGSRAHLVQSLNGLWEIDASPADVLTVDGRYALYVCIDVWSRRIIVSVTKTPRAEAVGLLMRKAILAWGMPDLVKTDNGSDFTARATRRLFASLGIETETASPFSPEQKGVVERAIGTLQRDFAATLPGFIGHSVADRKVIEQRKAFAARLGQDDARAFCVELTAEALQARADAWANDRYAHRPHGGLNGLTPFQRAASWTQPVRRVADEAALTALLAPLAGRDGLRSVGKQGLRIDGAHYLCADIMPGTQVLVRLDPDDLGRVWAFTPDGETFLGVAICPELAGVDRAAAVAEARAAQKRFIAERMAPIRAEANTFKPSTVADAVARRAAEQAGKLFTLPRRADRVSTPALDAIAHVETAGRAPAAAPLPERDRDLAASIEAELSGGVVLMAPPPAPAVRKLRAGPTPQQLYRKARALIETLEAGGSISTEDALWLGAYRESASFKALDGMYRDFGEAALR